MIAGLVVHLSLDNMVKQLALDAMSQRESVEIGEHDGQRVPILIDSRADCVEDSTSWLLSLPGVIHVDVVYIHFEDGEEESHPTNSPAPTEKEAGQHV